MNEERYLQALEKELDCLKQEERQDILRDFREYFSNGRSEGKTDIEIVDALGTPAHIAEELLKAYGEEDMKVTEEQPKGEYFTKVSIEADFADLDIIPSPDDRAYVDMKDQLSNKIITMDIEGDTLKIVIKEKKKWFAFGIILTFGSAPKVTIKLPKRMYDMVRIYNDNGATKAEQLHATIMHIESDNGSVNLKESTSTNLHVETDNGRISIKDVQSKTLTGETDNGRIELEHVQTETVKLKTDNGRIELRAVTGAIEAETDNGRIEAYIPSIKKPIRLETDNGSIQLYVKEKPDNATIQAKKDMGKSSIFGEKTKKVIFGDGLLPIFLKTDNGSITVAEK
ncbi:DUF4097 family beta strand repeat protein [Viridibacillus sp. YIM B01967]|uniref:DUF4097 family beta strand repeat protein n=1 Tax=Viridibacillus soli TaxID=2798301 RepID=A0ABS1H5G2_9BACL|nr:DUF4097 family beta strand repeat-containing protein [Viridibacillus soli]MBK3494644.1 DUF4097 family beta strand repeat protein [Viridibacillus soli]